MIFYDSETCGLHGIMVLLQWAEDDGPVQLHHVWTEPVSITMALIEKLVFADCLVGFNLAFDHFHLCKLYTIWRLLPGDWIPEDHISEIVALEPDGRTGPCLKPKCVLDLMLYSRKGPFQSLMDRKNIKIRRVPVALASRLAEYLDANVQIDDIYFSRQKDKSKGRWQVKDTKSPDFKDVVLKFAAGGGLKQLTKYVLGKEDVISFDELDKNSRPEEVGYAPISRVVPEGAWPDFIRQHIAHWRKPKSLQYAEDDVVNTRDLFYHFASTDPGLTDGTKWGDEDSVLACMVAAVRWRGFSLDLDAVAELRRKSLKISRSYATAPAEVMTELKRALKPEEQWCLLKDEKESTSKNILQALSLWEDHPVKQVAELVIRARNAKLRVNLCKKLTLAGRFHASFVIIGALSSRMSGSDGLNPMGIDRDKVVRSCFTLADEGYTLCGGDFDAFEVAIAEAVYNDPDLRVTLLSGKKIHALFGMELFDKTYEEVLHDKDMYTRSKSGVFAIIYGGEIFTLVRKLGVSEENATKAFEGFGKKYPGVNRARKRISDAFCSMTQPGGIGSRVVWKDPADYVESLFGFKRYFTLENRICKALFDLASRLPKEWAAIPIKVTRRDNRVQTVGGAVCSALYGAAFAIQASNMRAAANHEIQCTGAQATKHVQACLWSHQPVGIHEFIVIPMQIHDEINACVKHGHEDAVKETVLAAVESYRPTIPMIGMEWKVGMKSWAEKG